MARNATAILKILTEAGSSTINSIRKVAMSYSEDRYVGCFRHLTFKKEVCQFFSIK